MWRIHDVLGLLRKIDIFELNGIERQLTIYSFIFERGWLNGNSVQRYRGWLTRGGRLTRASTVIYCALLQGAQLARHVAPERSTAYVNAVFAASDRFSRLADATTSDSAVIT